MTRKKLLLGTVAIVIAIGCIAAGFLLTGSSPQAALAVQGVQAGDNATPDKDTTVAALTQQIQEALSLPSGEVSVSAAAPIMPGADVSLQWSGGIANVSTATGRIINLCQDRRSGVIQAPFLDNNVLDSAATRLISQLGWDEATLTKAGFRADKSWIVSQDMCEYEKTWVAYTSQGLRTDGFIQVRLDARDQHPVSFYCNPGIGDLAVDTSRAISQAEAEAIARAAIEKYISQQDGGASSEQPSATVDLTVGRSILKVTNAPAINDGVPTLIWLFTLNGVDSFGCATGGDVYIDANSGEIIHTFGF